MNILGDIQEQVKGKRAEVTAVLPNATAGRLLYTELNDLSLSVVGTLVENGVIELEGVPLSADGIREMVERSGLSYRDLEERSGIAASHISAYVTGARRPRLQRLQRLIDACREGKGEAVKTSVRS